jgi:hypothetical protein
MVGRLSSSAHNSAQSGGGAERDEPGELAFSRYAAGARPAPSAVPLVTRGARERSRSQQRMFSRPAASDVISPIPPTSAPITAAVGAGAAAAPPSFVPNAVAVYVPAKLPSNLYDAISRYT